MKDDLKLFILINGHELLGKLVSEADDLFVIEQPLGLQVVPQQDGSYGIQLVPFCSVNAEGEYNIYKHAICSEVKKIPEDIEKAYRRQTSRIQLL